MDLQARRSIFTGPQLELAKGDLHLPMRHFAFYAIASYIAFKNSASPSCLNAIASCLYAIALLSPWSESDTLSDSETQRLSYCILHDGEAEFLNAIYSNNSAKGRIGRCRSPFANSN